MYIGKLWRTDEYGCDGSAGTTSFGFRIRTTQCTDYVDNIAQRFHDPDDYILYNMHCDFILK